MHLTKAVSIPVTCVAVIITLAGCGNDSAPPTPEATSSTALDTPAPVEPVPAGQYDELVNWSSGESLPEMTEAGKLMGISDLTIPRPAFLDMGYVGVAPLESGCIVALSTVGADLAVGNLSATVMSRYSTQLTVAMANSSPSDLDSFFDEYRSVCTVSTGPTA